MSCTVREDQTVQEVPEVREDLEDHLVLDFPEVHRSRSNRLFLVGPEVRGVQKVLWDRRIHPGRAVQRVQEDQEGQEGKCMAWEGWRCREDRGDRGSRVVREVTVWSTCCTTWCISAGNSNHRTVLLRVRRVRGIRWCACLESCKLLA